MRAALEHAADPVAAEPLCAAVIEAAADGAAVRALWREDAARTARRVATLFGAAPFLAPFFVRHPSWLAELLGDDLRRGRTLADYRRRLEAGASDPLPVAERLRRFKYFELARITLRDLSDDLVPPEEAGQTLSELSHLADALLASALGAAAERMAESAGPPLWRCAGREVALGFCVLGMGKLGSQELNYSSDVDLIYVCDTPPDGDLRSASGLSPSEYFTRLAQELGRLVSEPGGEGFLYRVDLDLRPEGSRGSLVVTTAALAEYYELWAETWEKAAFMKARPVAGDLALGWRAIRAIDPMLFRSAMDLAGVAAIREMKEKVARAHGHSAGGFDVKIGAGGIRDVELVAQALQLLHGGRVPDVRSRSTQTALTALAQVGVLPREVADGLLESYLFLRRTENRLQMEAERQTHRLPQDPARLLRLARTMGFPSAAGFLEALDAHRQRVRRSFGELLEESGSERVMTLFAQHVPQLLANPTARAMLEGLAAHFARAIDAAPEPDRAMNNLDRFIAGVGRRRFYYELLLDRPELVPRLTALFSSSEYLSGYFASHPRLIEPIFSDPGVLLLDRRQLESELAAIRAERVREAGRDDAEVALDALRMFHNRQLINVGLLDIGSKVTLEEVEGSLTDIAEVCVEAALRIAGEEMRKRGDEPEAHEGELLVVAMGKFASREMTYGSDLDVIFLYDVPGASDEQLVAEQEHFVRLAQKLIWALRTRTSEGVCYEIDARLRPSGNQGMLVTTLSSFARYHTESAQVWERQALLRSRPAAGGKRLAAAFDMVRGAILRRPPPADLAAEIRRVRQRMETELAQESARRHDFKTGRGGLSDVENVIQYLQLRHGTEHPELIAVDRTDRHLARLAALGLITEDDARALREGWRFLQRLSNRLRIVENRSISDLDEERGDLEALARRLGYQSPQRVGGARRALLDDYRRHTEEIRRIYERVLRA